MQPRPSVSVATLRELFRNIQLWRVAYEDYGLDAVTAPDGEEFSIWDVEYLVQQLDLLTPRQRQSIQMCLIDNMREVDAARAMGLSPSNPVAMYATDGLRRLIKMIEEGTLDRWR